jgi:hypothetical protein
METSWVVLPVVDHAVTAEGDLTCIVCGGWHVDREVVVRGSGRLYENLAEVQERCTKQELELRDLRLKIASLAPEGEFDRAARGW